MLLYLISTGLIAQQLTLRATIDMAIQNNKDLLMAKEDVLIAENNYKDVRGQLFPQLSLVGSLSHTVTNLSDNVMKGVNSGRDALNDNEDENADELARYFLANSLPAETTEDNMLAGQIQFQQLIFSGGKLINGLKVLDRIKTMQEKRYILEMQNMVIVVVNAYYDLYLAQEGLKIQRQALESAENHLSNVEKLYDQGLVSEYDKLRAELEVSRLYPEVLNYENMENLAEENFRRLTGFTGSAEINPVLDKEILAEYELIIELDQAIMTANENRVELYLANLMTDIYGVQLKAERGNFLPTMVLQADLTAFNTANKFGSSDFGNSRSIGLALQMPLFTGLSNSSKTLKAKHELRRAEYDAINITELINLEVRQTWQTFYQSLKYLETQEKNISLASRALDIAQVRFENQTGIQLEVFDAQLQYSSAQISLAQAQINIIKAFYSLNKAIGNDLYNIIGDNS